MTFSLSVWIDNVLVVALCCLMWAAPSPSLASLSIHWSGPVEQEIGMGPGEWFTPIDFDNNGIADIMFRTHETTMYLAPLGTNEIVATSGLFVDRYRPISDGSLIEPDIAAPLLWESGEQTILSYMINGLGELVGGGSWYDVDNGYLGVSFHIDANLHYGWVRMTEDNMTLTVHDWAYETQAGVGINAGVIPEPSTVGLLFIGIVTLLVQWERNQKKENC